jgi:polyisoprenoid-binding protein YceI
MEAASLNTGNKQRDTHLHSPDFFDAEQHPQAVLTVRRAVPAADGRLSAEGTLETAGVSQPVSFAADVVDAGPDAVTLRAELGIDRSQFGMTWSPLRMAAMDATGSVTARFTRVPAASPPAAAPGTPG